MYNFFQTVWNVKVYEEVVSRQGGREGEREEGRKGTWRDRRIGRVLVAQW